MILTKRQTRRLKELSRMIDSTMTIRDDMVEINLDYAKEIEEFINKIKASRTNPSKKIDPVGNLSDSAEITAYDEENKPSDSRQTEDTTGEHQDESNYEPPPKHVDNVPAWAKSLWKKIAMKCHPDRLDFQKISAIEIARRQQYMLDSREAYEEAQWGLLLHIGVQLEEFVDGITSREQYSMLEKEYTMISSKVAAVQNSIAWQWGNNWENYSIRTQIVEKMCHLKGIDPPSKEETMRLLILFESE